jgi:hypothetical protein
MILSARSVLIEDIRVLEIVDLPDSPRWTAVAGVGAHGCSLTVAHPIAHPINASRGEAR